MLLHLFMQEKTNLSIYTICIPSTFYIYQVNFLKTPQIFPSIVYIFVIINISFHMYKLQIIVLCRNFCDVIMSIKSMKHWLHLQKRVMLRLTLRPTCEVVQRIPSRWREFRLYKAYPMGGSTRARRLQCPMNLWTIYYNNNCGKTVN